MAYSNAPLSSTELARRAKDYPLLIGQNWLRDASDMEWRDGGSWAAGADDTDPLGPAGCAADDFDHAYTYPDSGGATRYFLVDLGASAPGVFDTVIVRNVYSASGGTVSVEIADDNAYAVNLLEVASWAAPANHSNLISINLPSAGGGPRRYSGVRYLRLKYTGGVAAPKFSELIVGTSRQMANQPIEPFDRRHLSTVVSPFVADTGAVTQYVRRRKTRMLECSFRVGQDVDEATYESFWEDDMDGGVGCFTWIDQPTSAPTEHWWMIFPEPEMSKPRGNHSERIIRVSAVEQGPNYHAAG